MHPNLLHDVVAVRYLGGHRIWLRFEDGVEGTLDLREVIGEYPGVLGVLRDPEFIAQVRVHPEFGTITWPGELDLDPVVLYCAVKGIPVPTYEGRGKRTPRGVARRRGQGAKRKSKARGSRKARA